MFKKLLLIITVVFLILFFDGCAIKDNKGNAISNENSTSVSEEKIKESNESSSSVSITDVSTNDNISEQKETNYSKTNDNDVDEKTDKTTLAEEATYTQSDLNNKSENIIFTVTFKDYDGSVLKTENVKKNMSATAPEKPVRKGYRFVKWDTAYDNVKVDITVTAIYEEITVPSIIVDEATCKAGDVVKVKVHLAKNPGLLGMLVNIQYDESVMQLKSVKSGALMSEYMFTAPKNLKSGCNASWSTTNTPENLNDGEILLLTFKVYKNAEKNTYPVTISCVNNAFDNEYNVVPLRIFNGAVIIE